MLAIQKVESWIQERLSVADTEDVRFDVATEMIDVILSAICETAFDYEMPRWERNYLCTELEHALVSRLTWRMCTLHFDLISHPCPKNMYSYQSTT